MRQFPYREFLRHARRASKRADEAEDLLQTVLLAAVEAGRADMTCVDNQRWLMGALRKRALFDARSALRRRNRETSAALPLDSGDVSEPFPVNFITGLPAALRTTTLLALTGHNRTEIAWLLRLSDAALRQRIVSIKRRWKAFDGSDFSAVQGLSGPLPFGLIRRSLLKPVRQQQAILASHDPDGHLFIVCSQNGPPRQRLNSSTLIRE